MPQEVKKGKHLFISFHLFGMKTGPTALSSSLYKNEGKYVLMGDPDWASEKQHPGQDKEHGMGLKQSVHQMNLVLAHVKLDAAT